MEVVTSILLSTLLETSREYLFLEIKEMFKVSCLVLGELPAVDIFLIVGSLFNPVEN